MKLSNKRELVVLTYLVEQESYNAKITRAEPRAEELRVCLFHTISRKTLIVNGRFKESLQSDNSDSFTNFFPPFHDDDAHCPVQS